MSRIKPNNLDSKVMDPTEPAAMLTFLLLSINQMGVRTLRVATAGLKKLYRGWVYWI